MSYLRIKEILKDKGITSKEFAEKLGITENGLSLIVNGNRQPRFELLQKIADELNVSIGQLFINSQNSFNGYVEYNGTIYKIRTMEDIERLLSISKNH